MQKMKATLILENGMTFAGRSIGSGEERICEMVFNTSMTGYQEILTDPSYAGQGIVMSYPLIGNYGVNHEDNESSRPWAEALWSVTSPPLEAISVVRRRWTTT